jgi:hypothetical protein
LVRVFADEDVHKLALMPFMKLHPLYVAALKAYYILKDDDELEPIEKN